MVNFTGSTVPGTLVLSLILEKPAVESSSQNSRVEAKATTSHMNFH